MQNDICPCGKHKSTIRRMAARKVRGYREDGYHNKEREAQTKLTCPPKVEEFRQLYVRLLKEHGLEAGLGFFFGGCIRDFLLGGKIVDYDLITNIPMEKIKRILDNHKVYYEVNENKRDNHVYIPCEKDLIQIGYRNDIPPDFTINGLRANIVTLEITLCEECRKDIREGRLRLVNDDPRVPRRGIYMCYKYPFLKFEPESLKKLRKIDIVEENTVAFCERKKISVRVFYEIAMKWGLEKFAFLKKLIHKY